MTENNAMNANAVIVVSPAELARIVREAVREELHGRPVEPGEWLDSNGAAKLLQVHRRTVGKLVKNEALPVHRLGKLFRFRRAELVTWLERRAG